MRPDEVVFPEHVRVVFFDMDHTLIGSDSDVSWKQYLAEKGLAGWLDKLRVKWHFLKYRLGRLEPRSFMKFQLAQFAGRTPEEMRPLLEEHYATHVRRFVFPATPRLLASLRAQGRERVLITATNEAIARPFFAEAGLDALIATRLELVDGRYTGRIVEPYCWRELKAGYMRDYLEPKGLTLADASYWGDSINDVGALERVGFPVVANPSADLRRIAGERSWPIVEFGTA